MKRKTPLLEALYSNNWGLNFLEILCFIILLFRNKMRKIQIQCNFGSFSNNTNSGPSPYSMITFQKSAWRTASGLHQPWCLNFHAKPSSNTIYWSSAPQPCTPHINIDKSISTFISTGYKSKRVKKIHCSQPNRTKTVWLAVHRLESVRIMWT